MKETNIKKSAYLGLMGVLALVFVSFIQMASADTSTKLYTITQVTKNSAVLPIKDDKFKSQDVTVIVSIKNDSTGDLVEREVKTTLDSDGNGAITVKKLQSITTYTFKVRIMKPNGNSTDNSSSKDATTL